MTTTTDLLGLSSRRAESCCYALVMPPADGSRRQDRPLTRIAYGLWPQGFAGDVVGVLVDAGTGMTEAEIRAACTITLLDRAHYPHVTGAVTDHVQCCLDALASTEDGATPHLHEVVRSSGGPHLLSTGEQVHKIVEQCSCGARRVLQRRAGAERHDLIADWADPDDLAAELAGMTPEDRAVAERVAGLAEIAPAPGYEERAVERAKREGVLSGGGSDGGL